MTYTIAYVDDMLIATIPDGGDIHAAVRDYAKDARIDPIRDYFVDEGVALTNELPPNDWDDVVWDASGGHGGFLMDESRQTYRYAVRRMPRLVVYEGGKVD